VAPPPLAHSPTRVPRYVLLDLLRLLFSIQRLFGFRSTPPHLFISTSSPRLLRLTSRGLAALPSPMRLVKLYRRPTKTSSTAKLFRGARVPSLATPPRPVLARTVPRRRPSPARLSYPPRCCRRMPRLARLWSPRRLTPRPLRPQAWLQQLLVQQAVRPRHPEATRVVRSRSVQCLGARHRPVLGWPLSRSHSRSWCKPRPSRRTEKFISHRMFVVDIWLCTYAVTNLTQRISLLSTTVPISGFHFF